jgi:hypothetical protein
MAAGQSRQPASAVSARDVWAVWCASTCNLKRPASLITRWNGTAWQRMPVLGQTARTGGRSRYLPPGLVCQPATGKIWSSGFGIRLSRSKRCLRRSMIAIFGPVLT